MQEEIPTAIWGAQWCSDQTTRSHRGEPGSIPGEADHAFSHLRIVPDYAAVVLAEEQFNVGDWFCAAYEVGLRLWPLVCSAKEERMVFRQTPRDVSSRPCRVTARAQGRRPYPRCPRTTLENRNTAVATLPEAIIDVNDAFRPLAHFSCVRERIRASGRLTPMPCLGFEPRASRTLDRRAAHQPTAPREVGDTRPQSDTLEGFFLTKCFLLEVSTSFCGIPRQPAALRLAGVFAIAGKSNQEGLSSGSRFTLGGPRLQTCTFSTPRGRPPSPARTPLSAARRARPLAAPTSAALISRLVVAAAPEVPASARSSTEEREETIDEALRKMPADECYADIASMRKAVNSRAVFPSCSSYNFKERDTVAKPSALLYHKYFGRTFYFFLTHCNAVQVPDRPMRAKRGEKGAVLEYKGGGNERPPRIPADQWHRPAEVTPPEIESGSPWWEASSLTTTPPPLLVIRKSSTLDAFVYERGTGKQTVIKAATLILISFLQEFSTHMFRLAVCYIIGPGSTTITSRRHIIPRHSASRVSTVDGTAANSIPVYLAPSYLPASLSQDCTHEHKTDDGAVWERKGGGNGRTSRKRADQRHRPVTIPACEDPGATPPDRLPNPVPPRRCCEFASARSKRAKLQGSCETRARSRTSYKATKLRSTKNEPDKSLRRLGKLQKKKCGLYIVSNGEIFLAGPPQIPPL
ncbi:hypothetical protein PR048_017150 [Dryococelus australis]|uniref:Uncharacterized protein n=1 Tax=Dryococelus australis TaxID=614101 RepID=A0ABQ9H8P6_9NEOP|nr:hypothetical protein PR048_017150 [Dryococelus australis]